VAAEEKLRAIQTYEKQKSLPIMLGFVSEMMLTQK